MIQPEPEGSTHGYPPVSVEVLRFDTSAGNPVKEILLKLNLPDHRYSTLNIPIPDDRDDATVEQIRKRNKWENDDYLCRGIILNVICALRSLLRCMIVTSQSNNIVGPSVVNMIEHNNSIRYNDNKGKHKHQDIKANPSKKSKVTCWKCEKPGYLKKYCKDGKIGNKANGSGINGLVNGSSNSLKG
ncbi:hypothetical protein Tco_0458549 [Tanacetum coccineum]